MDDNNHRIRIKGRVFGEGKPMICVPVTESSEEDILSRAGQLAEMKVPVIEWRADYYEKLNSIDAVRDLLKRMEPKLQDTILLFTIRTAKQGGCCRLDEKMIVRLNEAAAATGVLDLIDMEFFEAAKPQKNIRRLQRYGVRVIASHHDFDCTPDADILKILIDQMYQGGADIAKLAVMPQNRKDVLRLLEITADIKEKYPDRPLITMSMGKTGAISRISGEFFGSCMTFGSVAHASAPGQLPYEKLSEMLDILHESLQEEKKEEC